MIKVHAGQPMPGFFVPVVVTALRSPEPGFTPTGFVGSRCGWNFFLRSSLTRRVAMPNDISDQDIRLSLARAFDRAWEGYYRSGRLVVSRDIARTELARRLVQLSKEGVRDEGRLVEAGLSHP